MPFQATKLRDGLWWVGALNPDLRVFDVVMRTETGTSYNAYLIRGAEKTALIESVKGGFGDEALDRVSSVCDPAEVDYVVCNHTEPDHSGSIAQILAACPRATVVSTRAGAMVIKALLGREFPSRIVKGGETIDLGGVTLSFVDAPFLHWPDSMFTFVPEMKTLFSCDVFGFHHTVPEIFADLSRDDLQESKKYYFDVIFAPFKKYVLEAIARIRLVEIEMICPSHGPVYRQDAWKVVDEYATWAKPASAGMSKRALIAYVSCYGMTRMIAEALAAGLAEAGISSDVVDVSEDLGRAVALCETADAILVGSPTLNRDVLPPVWQFLTSLSAITMRGRPCGAFGSYGWSGEAVKMIEDRMKSIGMKPTELNSRVNMKPHESDIETIKQAARNFGQELRASRQSRGA